MSSRRANNNRIRGPQSALTDFLAANNISAAQIRDSYEQRNRQAREQNGAVASENSSVQARDDDEDTGELPEEDESEQIQEQTTPKKRKRATKEKAKAKLQAKKKSKKDKGSSEDDDDSDYDDAALARDMYKKKTPMPGQLENCEACGKRFTVTPYSKTGDDGGLLCTPCGKILKKEQAAAERKAKKPTQGRARRKIESDRLEGKVSFGPKSLQDLCIEKAADVHNDIEEFGDIPDKLLNRLSEIFSKRRVMDSRTVQLFLRPDLDTVAVHDAAKLEDEDFKQIFAVVPNVQKLVLCNAGQFKDSVLEYMMEKAQELKFLQLYGANLVSNEMWKTFFKTFGHRLEALKLQWLDAAFDDEAAESLVQHCTNLKRLKLKFCTKLTRDFIKLLPILQNLEHLSIRFAHLLRVEDQEVLKDVIKTLGPKLKTLSLENLPDAQDFILHAIRANCTKVTKLRITDTECMTDNGFVALFDTSTADCGTKLHPLEFVNVTARDIDNNHPQERSDNPVGFASEGFKALMAHSGKTLRHLDIASCRHVSHAAFADVFDGKITYPELADINLSFCSAVDTGVIRGIFACCPKLKKLTAFGCFNIEDVVVPSGIALIGVPRAQDAIEQYGEAGMDLFSALGMMNEMIGVSAAA